jgi:hypothetical protein
MKERPILFSGPMVNAILEGRKTQTRRVIKPQPDLQKSFSHQYPPDGPRTSYGWSGWYPSENHHGARHYATWEHLRKGLAADFCPYGIPGDRLWVRETWTPDCVSEDAAKELGRAPVHYRADGEAPEYLNLKWRPSIFLPRKYSRITLEITDVRVQRLQEISEDDAQAEGRSLVKDSPLGYLPDTWDSINAKKHPWSSNPWVWAISFTVAP